MKNHKCIARMNIEDSEKNLHELAQNLTQIGYSECKRVTRVLYGTCGAMKPYQFNDQRSMGN